MKHYYSFQKKEFLCDNKFGTVQSIHIAMILAMLATKEHEENTAELLQIFVVGITTKSAVGTASGIADTTSKLAALSKIA